jgi:hypothetical protein
MKLSERSLILHGYELPEAIPIHCRRTPALVQDDLLGGNDPTELVLDALVAA